MRLALTMTAAFERYAQRPALADRRRIPTTNEDILRLDHGLLDAYETLTYRELGRRVRSVATQLRRNLHRGSATESGHADGVRVALLGHAGVDFTTIDFACNLAGLTTVPLHTSGTVEQQNTTLKETAPRLMVASVALLSRAADLSAAHPSVERVVVLDYRGGEEEHRQALEELSRRVTIPVETLDLDAAELTHDVVPVDLADDHLAMILYTSGSTGAPKGAMYTDRLVAEMWGGEGWSEFFAEDAGVVSFHYMPMSHVAGHSSVRSTLARGGVTCFASTTDHSRFFEDLGRARPTELSLVPRLCELLHQEYRRRLHDTAPSPDATRIIEEMRERVLGGRVGWASCTSAPISPELKSFMTSLLGTELHELYGTTEIGGVLADSRFLRPPVVDYRLEDVPELGYYSSDRPHRRGELLIKSSSTVPGYFNRPQLNASIFTEDGCYRTGDVVAVDDDGNIRIIDRKNAIIKLAQGEFVALPSLEATFVAGSTAIRQVFLYGRSEQSSILAVIVPAEEDGGERSTADAVAVRARFLGELRKVAAEERLNSYEIPAAVLLELEPFSEANGLLSDHGKPIRPRLSEKYGARLEALYEELRSARDEMLDWLFLHGAEGETITTVRRAVAVALQADPDDIDQSARFRGLGGDSLTAVHLSRLLEQIYGFRVSVDTVVSESYSLRDLADHIDVKRTRDHRAVSFEEIHGAGAARLRATDLTVPRFVGQVDDASSAPSGVPSPRSVLVTGAPGYLGRFVCLDLLRRFAGSRDRVVCLVRASDDRAARARLRDTFSSSAELLADFDSVAENLDIVAGDLAEPRLGLDGATWDRLVRDTTEIVHAGAMVNHALPYEELFAANVGGTAEVIRLAIAGTMKPVTFMSSIATALLPAAAPPLDEFDDIRAVLPEVGASGGIVDGYATTKWAGEILLRDAHDRFGLPVTVFRASMILAHSYYEGQINVPDTFTRLLYSVTRTGLAPRSFYRSGRRRAHYDGLPVDTVARAVTTLAETRTAPDFVTYHLVNPFDDGISLDTMLDWLVEAGSPMTRVDSYDAWVQRFRSALGRLDEEDKRASLLPLLDGFKDPAEPAAGSLIASSQFSDAIRAAGEGHLITPLSKYFLLKCVRDIEYVFAEPILPEDSGSSRQ